MFLSERFIGLLNTNSIMLTASSVYELAREGKKPYVGKSNRHPENQIKFLLQPGNMEGRYLGACLDSGRWGSQDSVMYDLGIKGLIDFIQNWMGQNPRNFMELWHDKEHVSEKLELPHKSDNKVLSLENIVKCLNIRPETDRTYCPPKKQDAYFGCTPERLKGMTTYDREVYDLLEHCFGHDEPHEHTEFHFDGWDLSAYVQKWHEQVTDGKALVFESRK